MPCRPALGRAVFGAGAEDRQLFWQLDAERASVAARCACWRCRRGCGSGRGSAASGRFGELREALGHLRQQRLVQRVAAVDQSVAGFADETDALGNVGKERNQRRLERIGQDVGALVAALCQLASQPVARFQRQFAMREGAVDDVSLISGIRSRTGATQRGARASSCRPGFRSCRRMNSGCASTVSPIQDGATIRVLS
jgi:hypothetical protein